MKETIKIGTRGSQLALWQAYYIQEKLQQAGATTELVIIETKGDKILDRALSKIGSKGVFTEELEEQLLNGGIDIAVHSTKDLPSDVGENFEVIAFTEREKPNDVLVSNNPNITLETISEFVIGTSSTRRIATLKAQYPTIKIVDMRGNLQTRIRKMEEGECDALVLAFAGVHRMGYDELIRAEFSMENVTTAVGQGSVAIEVAKNLVAAKKEFIGNACNHPKTERLLLIERAFLNEMNGGCSIPVFGNASYQTDGTILFRAGITSLDGEKKVTKTAVLQEKMDENTFGREIAKEILTNGGKEILAEIRTLL